MFCVIINAPVVAIIERGVTPLCAVMFLLALAYWFSYVLDGL